MKIFLIMLFSSIFLVSCNSNDEIEEETADAEPVEETEENENEMEEMEEPTSEASGETESSESLEEESEHPDPVVIEKDLWQFETASEFDIRVEVGPILLEADLAILPLSFSTTSEEDLPVHRTIIRSSFNSEDGSSHSDVRLIDSENMTVSQMAMISYDDYVDKDSRNTFLETFLGEGSKNDRAILNGEQDTVKYATVFAAPESDHVHVFLPKLGVAANVPVVDKEKVGVTEMSNENNENDTTNEEEIGMPDIIDIIESQLTRSNFEELDDNYYSQIEGRTVPLESYQESMDTSVSRINEINHSTLLLSSDVLFATDSADLHEEADHELEAAIQELVGVEGGELEIVGHTDNVASEDYNQTLSEDRAQSVHDRLEGLTNLGHFDAVSVSGESYREPIADNETEEGRRENRRVEIQFTPPTEFVEVEVADMEPPEAYGEVATFPEAVTVQHGEVEMLSLQQIDNMLVGNIRVHAANDELDQKALRTYGDHATSLTGARGWSNHDSVGATGSTLYHITILHGDKRYFPLDYFLTPLEGSAGAREMERSDDEDLKLIVPLSELDLPGSPSTMNPGEDAYYDAIVVWPAVDAEEVAVELGLPGISLTIGDIDQEVKSVQPWRITDVPIERDDR
ncbi:OmpA family protein [Virgibacillus oceani]